MWKFKANKLKDEIIARQSRVIESLTIKQFRVGDEVYISDGKRDPKDKYFLLEPYNGGECYFVGLSNDFNHMDNCIVNGVNVKHLSHSKPRQCECCGSLL